MVSLNDLRSAAVALDWHEAVAAGAALAALLVETRAPACPHPADVALLSSGDLRVSGPGHLDASPVAGVAQVLTELLEAAPCPAELRQLIEIYGGDSRTGEAEVDAVGDLLSALAFYERPGRRDVLAAVALRAAPALDGGRRAAALEALTERTRLAASGAETPQSLLPVPRPAPVAVDAPLPGDDAPEEGDPPEDGGLRRMILPAAVGLAAFLAVAYVTASWLDRSPEPAPSTEAADEELSASGASTTAPPPASAPRPQRSSPPPRERAAGSPATPPTVGPPAVTPAPATATPAVPRAVDVVVAERDGRVVASPIAPMRPAPRPTASGRVFQSGDPQVTPAVLVRPRLPDNPPSDVPAEQIGTLEFIVAESGAVEHVHLVSPTNRYQERMLVAAAKAWQFQPATRDGRPVRFRTRIRVPL